MADDHEEYDDAEVEQSKNKQKAEQAKAMDKMTDVAPEKQMDESRVKQAMTALAASQKADKEAQRQRDKELAAVKVVKEDIDAIAAEFEVDKKLAERRLREHGGDLMQTLKSFL